jgi:hypothetical protein
MALSGINGRRASWSLEESEDREAGMGAYPHRSRRRGDGKGGFVGGGGGSGKGIILEM